MFVDVWERQGGESNLWYSRFEIFRILGPGRSIDRAYRASLEGDAEGREGSRANRHWRRAADRWNWQERAEAWDAFERERLRALEEDRRFAARQRRLEAVEQLQIDALAAIRRADLSELTAEQARVLLGSLRMLLSDMMRAERLEFGEATEIVDDGGPGWTSDDMAAAAAEIEEWRKKRKD